MNKSSSRDGNAASASPPLRFTLITSEAALRALVPAWEELLQCSATDEPMLSPLWLLPWWEVYGRGTNRRLRVGAWWRGTQLVGLALLQARMVRYRRVIPFRRLEFLGADVDEHDGVCSEYLNLLAARDQEVEIAQSFGQALRLGRFGTWDEVVLAALDGSQPICKILLQALRFPRSRMEERTITQAPYIPLPSTWADYVAVLGRHKRLVLKSQRDLAAWAQDQEHFHRAVTATEVAVGARILHALHAERWGEDGQAGAFQAPRFARFHELVMQALLERDALELCWLTVRGEPISISYSIRWRGKIYFYQSGRKMQLPAHVRAGIVLHAEAIRTAIAAGCREYDFLGGGAQYKTQLALAQRPVLQLRILRSSVRERLREAAEMCITRLRGVRASVTAMLKSSGTG